MLAALFMTSVTGCDPQSTQRGSTRESGGTACRTVGRSGRTQEDIRSDRRNIRGRCLEDRRATYASIARTNAKAPRSRSCGRRREIRADTHEIRSGRRDLRIDRRTGEATGAIIIEIEAGAERLICSSEVKGQGESEKRPMSESVSLYPFPVTPLIS